ncbi:MAG: DsbA family protein [candidate division NC10 bacterium]|nr:DsbA family protein [candidate division NC10 bacterium]
MTRWRILGIVWTLVRVLGLVAMLALGIAGAAAAAQAEALLEALERGPGPNKGNADAPVTIVEFSDFQCSFCRKFWRETLPRIEEKYIRTGSVRFVYRHLAILGPPSVQAAIAAECAHEQGKFWPYHDRLFASAGLFAFSESNLKRYAEELGLDTAKFGACLDAAGPREKVERETVVGRAIGMTGTPGFLINGGRMIGAQPYEVFDEIIEGLLKDAGQGQPRAR